MKDKENVTEEMSKVENLTKMKKGKKRKEVLEESNVELSDKNPAAKENDKVKKKKKVKAEENDEIKITKVKAKENGKIKNTKVKTKENAKIKNTKVKAKENDRIKNTKVKAKENAKVIKKNEVKAMESNKDKKKNRKRKAVEETTVVNEADPVKGNKKKKKIAKEENGGVDPTEDCVVTKDTETKQTLVPSKEDKDEGKNNNNNDKAERAAETLDQQKGNESQFFDALCQMSFQEDDNMTLFDTVWVKKDDVENLQRKKARSDMLHGKQRKRVRSRLMTVKFNSFKRLIAEMMAQQNDSQKAKQDGSAREKLVAKYYEDCLRNKNILHMLNDVSSEIVNNIYKARDVENKEEKLTSEEQLTYNKKIKEEQEQKKDKLHTLVIERNETKKMVKRLQKKDKLHTLVIERNETKKMVKRLRQKKKMKAKRKRLNKKKKVDVEKK